MSLAEIWTSNPEQLRNKLIQQIISFAGDGRLLDGSRASLELQRVLGDDPWKCRAMESGVLHSSFPDNGLALQDLVNEVGAGTARF